MTVHWLDAITRARMHAVLTCIRLKGHHTYDILAQAMIDIHYEFHIDKKITRSVKFIFRDVTYGDVDRLRNPYLTL